MSDSLTFKLVLLGDSAVGKSSIVERFCKDKFTTANSPTIGASFFMKELNVDGVECKFEIWDTAGQERYKSLTPMYYRDASAALIVYDITSGTSFKGACAWIEELKRQATQELVIGLAGNKLDMEENREVPKEDVEKFAEQNNCIFSETSAKSGENISEIFLEIAKKLPRDNEQKDANEDDITIIEPADDDGKGCCKK